MARHQGKYKPNNPAPYELSRTAIEKMVRCEACFWLEKVKGVSPAQLKLFDFESDMSPNNTRRLPSAGYL